MNEQQAQRLAELRAKSDLSGVENLECQWLVALEAEAANNAEAEQPVQEQPAQEQADETPAASEAQSETPASEEAAQETAAPAEGTPESPAQPTA